MAKEKKQIDWEACYKYIQRIVTEVEKELKSALRDIYEKQIYTFMENYPPRIILSFERPNSMRRAFLKDKEFDENLESIVKAMEEVARNRELRIEKEKARDHMGKTFELDFAYAFKPDYNIFKIG